jgi:hypothetical protein
VWRGTQQSQPVLAACLHWILIGSWWLSSRRTVVRELTACGVRCLLCTLTEDCGAEAFMDEEDAEAVAERLRQLGYL